MNQAYIFNLIQPCKNRCIKFQNNGDGSVAMDGQKFETMRECEAYLEGVERKDMPK